MEAITTRTQARKPASISVPIASTMILPPLAGELTGASIPVFVPETDYTYGAIVVSGGAYYWCITAGTAASGATPPAHVDGDASDDNLEWRHIPWARNVLSLVNTSANIVTVARGADAESGKGIVLNANAAHNEGYDGGPLPYAGAWYAIGNGGVGTLAISEG